MRNRLGVTNSIDSNRFALSANQFNGPGAHWRALKIIRPLFLGRSEAAQIISNSKHTIGSLARKRIIKHSCTHAFRAETVAFVKNAKSSRQTRFIEKRTSNALQSCQASAFRAALNRQWAKKMHSVAAVHLASVQSTRFRGHTMEMDRMNYSWQFDAFQLNWKLFILAFVCTLPIVARDDECRGWIDRSKKLAIGLGAERRSERTNCERIFGGFLYFLGWSYGLWIVIRQAII